MREREREREREPYGIGLPRTSGYRCDVLHRQISNSTCIGKLFREFVLTTREGSSAASALHGRRRARSTGTRPAPAAVPTEGPTSNASRVEELQRPPAQIAPSAPAVQSREHACELVAALLLVPLSVVGVWIEPRLAQAYARACSAHDLMLVTVSSNCVSRWQAAGHISSEGSG